MKRSYLIDITHKSLQDPDKGFIKYLFDAVNLTLLEKEIVYRSEIDGTDLETICNTLENWNNQSTICSYANCARIKRSGMIKIGGFISSRLYAPRK